MDILRLNAMEQQSLKRLISQEEFEEHVQANKIYINTQLHNRIDTFKSKLHCCNMDEAPKTVREAVIRIHTINRIVEKSEFHIDEYCTVTSTHFVITNIFKNSIELPHHMMHNYLYDWFKTGCNNALLSHEKTIEAVTLILKKLGKKGTGNNSELCIKIVNGLPACIAQYIKNEFITMFGWPDNLHPEIVWDNEGNITSILLHDIECLFQQDQDWFPIKKVEPDDVTKPEISTYTLFQVIMFLKSNYVKDLSQNSLTWKDGIFEELLTNRTLKNEEKTKKVLIIKKVWDYVITKFKK